MKIIQHSTQRSGSVHAGGSTGSRGRAASLARVGLFAAALSCGGGQAWATATKADAEFVANWDAVVGYCSALRPAEATQYKLGQDSVFQAAPAALVAEARLRSEYKPRYDAALKQLKKGNASPVAATCSTWSTAVNGPKWVLGSQRR